MRYVAKKAAPSVQDLGRRRGPSPARWFIALALWFALGAGVAQAHTWNPTRVRATFGDARHAEVRIDIDLTRLLDSAGVYFALTQAAPAEQDRRLREIFATIWPRMQARAGDALLAARLDRHALPSGPRGEFGVAGVAKFTTFEAAVELPADAGPLWFSPESDVQLEYPLAVTFAIPAQNFSMTRWIDGPSPTRRFDFAAHFSAADAGSPTVGAPAGTLDLTPGETRAVTVLLTLWRYLRLGFLHIVPTGADHILFVIGLFFLGISWRKLITQTTVFTIAHTTTLGLSAAGIFSLPAWFVEPAIATSIAFVAIENIVRPKLTPGRLAVVFMFGLIHGLGFAGSLHEVGLPKDEFWVALLAFNFGVDFGQLFVLALCFLAFGAFRRREWFRARIVIPACGGVALIGLIWAVQRVVFYAGAGGAG